uniref:Integral membrane protein n=1 Tax=uncultured Nocardioidaceae bacterium TaxID=253824 RepID=A0A6J4MCH3_9ACTN|nr:MAG: Integral membrane protein [uncultured Nocardioidaceae bacterium]
MSPVAGLVLTVVLLGLNALFVGSEFALISARRTQIEPRAAAGSRAARMTLQAMERLSLVMAAAQLGITICTLALGAVSEPVVAHLLEPAFAALRVPEGLVHPIAFVVATTLIVYAHVVLGEMVPKNVTLAVAERSALILGPFMLAMVVLLKPFVVTLNAMANGILQLLRVEPKEEVTSSFTHDEVAGMVEESRREGLLDEDEYGLLSGALDFHAGTVSQVLLPAADLVTVQVGSSVGDVEAACARTGHSRFPVTHEGSDELIGYVHIKDVLAVDDRQRAELVQVTWVRALATVRSLSSLYDALRAMQVRGSHMARVADDEGMILGVVMLEDVLEELVGEVRGGSAV